MQLDRSSISGGENSKGGGSGGGGEWTSILTTVCNHSFHMDCLLQWQDSPCPVCRYDHSGLNEALSQCQVCGRTENIFVCLICGVVSCGRGSNSNSSTSSRLAAAAAVGHQQPSSSSIIASPPPAECSSSTTPDCTTSSNDAAIMSSSEAAAVSSSHARQHYDETLHAYALDTETQHVWDFSGSGYVHRLLQNKEDGKLVEVNDPSNTASQERSLNPGLSTRQEGEVVHRKLEGFASQYYTLLKSQLEQQRIYYEGRLEEIRREHEYKDNGGRRHHHHSSRKKGTSDLINALKQERHQLSQRLSCLGNRYRKVRDDAAFLKSMNESLEANKSLLKKQLADAQRDRVEAKRALDACIPPLQEKVTVLMLQLESEMTAAAEAAAAAEAKAAQPTQPQLLSGEDSKKPAAK